MEATLAGRRILTVDPSARVGEFLLELLTGRGATCTQATTEADARALFGTGRFDVVILDIALPGGDGLALLGDMRRQDDDCVLVVLTSSGGGRALTASIRAGGDAYLEKQHLADGGDNEYLFDALGQAFEHRSGAIARRRLEVMKTDFYSMVTHDLRNPAGNVLVALKLLQGGKGGPLTPKQAQLVDLAARSATKFVDLINDYLDFAKIDAGYLRLERAEADLMALVGRSVEMARPQSELKSLEVEVQGPSSLSALVDAAKLEQVVDNLVSNAIKYSPDGGRIGILVSEQGSSARIEVSDLGPGIAPGQLDKLFTKYHRAPGQAASGVQGTGLGLLIIKEIVEAHGGRVTVRSAGEGGQGTTFAVDIPRFAPSDPAVG